MTISNEGAMLLNSKTDDKHNVVSAGTATVFQTSLNITKICMGTGTLALPYASQVGGLVFNALGLLMIGLWNYYSANCLMRCLDLIPPLSQHQQCPEGLQHYEGIEHADNATINYQNGLKQQLQQGDQTNVHVDEPSLTNSTPPFGSTAYGRVAYFACESKGLLAIDVLLLSLYFGLSIAYNSAMMSFISSFVNISIWLQRFCLLIPNAVLIPLSCLPNVGFLSKCSGIGLMALTISFLVISLQGFWENGLVGLSRHSLEEMNLLPEDLSAASSWFGVVVFGFGIVPFILNLHDSMAKPQLIYLSLKMGLGIVYVGYV